MASSYEVIQNQNQSQSQKQMQKLSQRQIQALAYLAMTTKDLREEILKAVSENPALEIVKDPLASSYDNSLEDFRDESYRKTGNTEKESSDEYQKMLENNDDDVTESLQEHLMKQVNLTRLSVDEYSLCKSLIYNLDKNGCYGSMLDPMSFLDKSRPTQTASMLKKCMNIIQRMDPVGTCCKNIEESLYIQTKIKGDASDLTLFILNGHLDLLIPPQPDKVLRNLQKYKTNWHEKAFAQKIILDEINLTEKMVEDSINYIQGLNPRPAGEYISEADVSVINQFDIVLKITKENGLLSVDDFEHGKIVCDKNHYFQVKYSTGDLPEIRISKDFSYDKVSVEKAKIFISCLDYRKSTIVSQGCELVKFQKEFFDKGPEFIKPLTRKQVAAALKINQSTVSRMSSKKNSKYIQTDYGLYPISYFYSSSLQNSKDNKKISSTLIKQEIDKILSENKNLSDSKLTEYLQEKGIKISRRTVAKYRLQIGIENSYNR